MENRGFTLIELIGVIIILALLTLIIVPNVVSNLREGISESKEYQNDSIILGAKNWASDHKDELPLAGDDDEFIDIIKMDIDEAYQKVLDGEIVDAKTVIAIMYAYQKDHQS